MKTRGQARGLAMMLGRIGKAHGVRVQSLITAMDVPLGRMVGHALEVKECIEALQGGGPADLRALTLELAARMVHLGDLASLDKAREKVREALDSGQALEKFRRMVEEQGGDPRIVDNPDLLPQAPSRELIRAARSGYAQGWEAESVGRATVELGGGRNRVEDVIDPAVGAVVRVRPGDPVREGDALLELHYRDPEKLRSALELLRDRCPITDAPPQMMPLVLEELP